MEFLFIRKMKKIKTFSKNNLNKSIHTHLAFESSEVSNNFNDSISLLLNNVMPFLITKHST